MGVQPATMHRVLHSLSTAAILQFLIFEQEAPGLYYALNSAAAF